MRTITVTGNITQDAVIRQTKDGREFITFRMVNHEFDKNMKVNEGEKKQDTYWYGVTASMHFKNYLDYYKKGRAVVVLGPYTDKVFQRKDGNYEVGREIIADQIKFLEISYNVKDAKKVDGNEVDLGTANVASATPQVMGDTANVASAIPQVMADSANASEDDDLPF